MVTNLSLERKILSGCESTGFNYHGQIKTSDKNEYIRSLEKENEELKFA
jgi:hypothetical protein